MRIHISYFQILDEEVTLLVYQHLSDRNRTEITQKTHVTVCIWRVLNCSAFLFQHVTAGPGDFDIGKYAHQEVDRFGVLLDLWNCMTTYLECKREVITVGGLIFMGYQFSWFSWMV